jgi:DNA polymerase-1
MLQICRMIRDKRICAVDTETTGLDISKDIVLFWSLCPDLDTRFCLDPDLLEIFSAEIGNDPNITWVMTNANYDNNILANSGVPLLAGPIRCTLVMDWLYDENKRHGLKDVAQRYLHLNMEEFKSVFKKGRKETYQDTLIRIMNENPQAAIDYASCDAWASLAVHHYLKDKLEHIPTFYDTFSLWDLFNKIEVPYSKVLYHCERRGVMIDRGYLQDLSGPMQRDMDKISRRFNKLAGIDINIGSPTQLRKLFFDTLGREPLTMTKGGESGNAKPQLNEDVLAAWKKDGCEYSAMILEWRDLQKTKGTYIDGMISRADRHGRIHPTLNQSVTVTGRLSSGNPNLQNIKRPDEDPYDLRGAFMPGQNFTLVTADYKQLEMRIMADLSEDENMRDVIRKGWDIHMGTASLMYNVPYEDLVKAKKEGGRLEKAEVPRIEWPEWVRKLLGHRLDSKTIGFGLNYSKGKRALAEDLGCSVEEAEEKIERYFAPYPRVQQFIEETHQFCRQELEVYTYIGRIRRLVDANADWRDGYFNPREKKWTPERPGRLAARALRQDVNSRIQGGAADVARLAQLRLEGGGDWESRESERLRDLGVRQILQIHDEIMMEVPPENLEEAIPLITELMEHPFEPLPEILKGFPFRELSIPLGVDIGHGESWTEAH